MERINTTFGEGQYYDNSPWVLENPLVTYGILGIYLLLIYILLPYYMRDRKPYRLKAFITIYNIIQVLGCIKLVHMIHTSNTPYLMFWKCSIATNNNYEGFIMNRLRYYLFWLKGAELIETVLFALRKKTNQISILHVFHHFTVFFLIHLTQRFYKGEKVMYPLFLNALVHIIMYSYYLLTAISGQSVLRRIKPFKKYITGIQMIQFTLILFQVAGQIITGCDFPPVLLFFYTIIVSVIFYMFFNFYKKNYTKHKPKDIIDSKKLR